jgi:selenocysteine lyase/cysteine desulfurase
MLSCQRDKFSLPADQTYLNGAFMSPLLKSVEKLGIEGIQRKRYPGFFKPEDFYDDANEIRVLFSKIIDNPKPQQIVVMPSVSYGIASVTKNIQLSPGQKVIVVDEQFPSNIYSWQRLVAEQSAELMIIKPDPDAENRAEQWNHRILEAINKDTAVVTMAQAHWADGTKFDLKAIRKKTHDVGALLIIDGTQSVGAMPFSINELKPDALICAAYKWMMGPFSSSLGYFSERFNSAIPIEENWINRKESQNFAQLVNYQPEYMAGARRFEAGQSYNFALLPMLKAALSQLIEWEANRIQAYCQNISKNSINTLIESGYSIENERYRGSHLFGVRIPRSKNIEILKNKITTANISVSYRGNAIRVSPNVYNTEQDLEQLVNCLV